MQQIILVILAAVYALAIIRQIWYWVWLWQLKEYRWDKLRAHFKDIGARSAFLALIGYSALRQKGASKFTVKAILISVFSFLSAITASVLIIRFYSPQIFLAIFSFNRFSFLNLSFSKDLVSLEVIKSLFLNIINFLDDYEIIIVIMAVIYLFMPVIIYLMVSILNVLSAILKKITIARAKAKISRFSDLKVIGITGSYGKSITKEILADILSKKYKVLRTPHNINTAIGIAQLILKQLDESYEVFVVEMGAYKIGEIKEICDMVKPRVGIITAINEQHLALFGNIKNTIKAKFELVDCLPKEGLVILNAGDVNIQAGIEFRNSLFGGIKSRVKLYSVGAKSDVYAIGVTSDRQSVKFKFISGSSMNDFAVNIKGAHNISNILAAITAAQEIGMDLGEISQILQKVNYLDVALKNLIGPNGSILIDDTYNSNPDGVFAALNYIKNQGGRKIIVMSSLIELGFCSRKIHQKIGKEISQVASKVFFLDTYYIVDIKKGMAKNEESDTKIEKQKNVKKISEYLKNELKPSDTVLFINRGARKVLGLLKK